MSVKRFCYIRRNNCKLVSKPFLCFTKFPSLIEKILCNFSNSNNETTKGQTSHKVLKIQSRCRYNMTK